MVSCHADEHPARIDDVCSRDSPWLPLTHQRRNTYIDGNAFSVHWGEMSARIYSLQASLKDIQSSLLNVGCLFPFCCAFCQSFSVFFYPGTVLLHWQWSWYISCRGTIHSFFNDQIMQLNVNLWEKTFCNRRNHEGCCDLSFFLWWLECTHRPLLFVIYTWFIRESWNFCHRNSPLAPEWHRNASSHLFYLPQVTPNQSRARGLTQWVSKLVDSGRSQVCRSPALWRRLDHPGQLLWSWLELLNVNSADIHASLDYCETII